MNAVDRVFFKRVKPTLLKFWEPLQLPPAAPEPCALPAKPAPIPDLRVNRFSVSRPAPDLRSASPAAMRSPRCRLSANRISRPAHMAPDHRKVFVAKQIADQQDIRARLSRMGADRVPQIPQSHILGEQPPGASDMRPRSHPWKAARFASDGLGKIRASPWSPAQG